MTLCLMVARQIRQKVAFNGKLEDFMKYANGASKLFYRTEVCIICASIHSFSLIAASFVDPYLLQLIIIIIIIINEFHRDASLTKLQGRCVSRVTLVSMLLLPVVCVAV